MADGKSGKPAGRGETGRLRRRIAELEERLENAESLYADLLGLFESETGRRKSVLSEITLREKELERRELQLRQERVLSELWHCREFYDSLERRLQSRAGGSALVFVRSGKASGPAAKSAGPWLISGVHNPERLTVAKKTLILKPDGTASHTHLWIRLRAAAPARIKVYRHSGRALPKKPSERLSIARDGIIDFFLHLPDTLPREIRLEPEKTKTAIEILDIALITPPPGKPAPASRTTLRLNDWMAPERGERISDGTRRKPFKNDSIPFTLAGDGEAFVDLHTDAAPQGEKLLWLRFATEESGSFRIRWNQERDESEASIDESSLKVDVKDPGNFRDYAIPLPYSRIDNIRIEFPQSGGRIDFERAELWQFPSHGLSPEPLRALPAIFTGEGLSPWISPAEAEREISFMDGDFIDLPPAGGQAGGSNVRRLVSPPLNLKADAFLAGASISHQYETRARLLVDFGDGYFVPDSGEIEVPPGTQREASVRFDGGRLRQVRWEFDMGLSDATLKVHGLFLAAAIERDAAFTLVPRCMHFSLFEPLLAELARRFPRERIAAIETNFDNLRHYPENVIVFPYEATRYIASELAAYFENKLEMRNCKRMVVPVMNPDGKGYEEFFRFGKLAGIERILIIEADGSLADAPA